MSETETPSLDRANPIIRAGIARAMPFLGLHLISRD